MTDQSGTRGAVPAPHPYARASAVSASSGSNKDSSKRAQDNSRGKSRSRKRRVADVVLPQRVRDLVPESRAYMELLELERHVDTTIMRKRLEIQEALKRQPKVKRKLRVFISHSFSSGRTDGEEDEAMPHFDLRIEGRLLDDPAFARHEVGRARRKLSSFFKRVVVEFDQEQYGPDQHIVEWTHPTEKQESDGFLVRCFGEDGTKCVICMYLDYQPAQVKLDPALGRLLGIHTQTRTQTVTALWQYIKTNKLQDPNERQYINCDKYLKQVFDQERVRFTELPSLLSRHVHAPDPIIINYGISNDPTEQKKTVCYDIDVEVDDPLRVSMSSSLMSPLNQQEISGLDSKIHDAVEQIHQHKTRREFFLQYSKNPQEFINQWLASQAHDLQVMRDESGNPEEERRADFYSRPWAREAVCRYFYRKMQQRRTELEQALGMRS